MKNAKVLLLVASVVVFAWLVTTGHAQAGEADSESAKAAKLNLPDPAVDSDYYDNGTPDQSKVQLGKLLYFDKILSGNMNISCASCHHPLVHTGDGLSLGTGEGAKGLAGARDTGSGADAVVERVPRNAPTIFNSGAREFSRMFWDGRVEVDSTHPSGFRSPAGDALPFGLDNPLAVQAMFPPTSGTEMAGQAGENTVADAGAAGNLAGPGGVWEQLAARVQGIPEYVDLFELAYPEIDSADDITFVHIANAIAAFEGAAWRADNSPFDRYLRGDTSALNKSARRGMKLFYKTVNCARCHAGTFQTDQSFHNICMPQIGPGKGDGIDGHDDYGRERVTGDSADRFRFRTPSLRNVALTGPWGHAGAYDSLEAVIRHHLDATAALEQYDSRQAVLPSRPDLDALDLIAYLDPARRAEITQTVELTPVVLTDAQIVDLLEFLRSLTDPASMDLRLDLPTRVPSGLPMAD